MPAESEKQREAAGVALSVKRGKAPLSSLRGTSKQMYKMTRSQLEDYARKPGKPQTTTRATGLAKERKAKAKHSKPKSSHKPHKGRAPKGRSSRGRK